MRPAHSVSLAVADHDVARVSLHDYWKREVKAYRPEKEGLERQCFDGRRLSVSTLTISILFSATSS